MFELYKFKSANAKYNGKGVFKCEGTFYHLTPNDLGKTVYLEPRKPLIEDFKSLCVANYLIGCLVAMPKEKQVNDSFYLYRNFQPGTAHREILSCGSRLNEAKIFRKTKFIRIGKVHNCLAFFEELKRNGEIFFWHDTEAIYNLQKHIVVEKEKNTSIILVSYGRKKYSIA